jgi:prophage tail gpP-like protein
LPTSSDDVALRIFGKQWHAWDELEVHLALDEHASVGFRAPFEVERKEFRETFRPFSFAPLDIAVGGSPVFTGTLFDVTPDLSATERSVEVSAYSKAAVLDECDPPASILPVEANGLTLKQIAQRLAEPFGVGVMVDGPEGAPFKRVKTRQKKVNTKAEADEKIGDFLAELARQRGFVVSSNGQAGPPSGAARGECATAGKGDRNL